MNTPPPTGNPTVWLTLQAHDAAALIDYYTTTFGFVVAARCDGDGDTVAHAELHWPQGTGAIMLGSYRPGRPWCRQPGTAGGYVVTADPEALYRRVCERRADVVMALTDTDYGSREFAVRDPEGNLWSFGSYPGAPGSAGKAQ
ncbi:MAG TPA: VOC family protein [Mycolicibacillus parakoreensis]|nr:VOC family protein [Mycolicibacillus parakoreensis]